MQWPQAQDVCLSFHTLSGNMHGEPVRNDLRTRAIAAHHAGLRSVGVCTMDYRTEAELRADAEFLGHLEMGVQEVEWLELSKDRDHLEEGIAFHMAQVLGAQRINVGWCSARPAYGVAPLLKEWAHRARDFGDIQLAFEPVVFGSVGSITMVQDYVAEVGEPNVGTLLDTWQLATSWWYAATGYIQPGMVKGIQLTGVRYQNPLNRDSSPAGLYLASQQDRELPDQGDFPVRQWLAELIARGVDCPVACEVISTHLRGLKPVDAAGEVAQSLHRMLGPVPAKEVVL